MGGGGHPDLLVSAPASFKTLACHSALLNGARPASIADTRPPTGTIQIRARVRGRSVTHTHVSAPLPAEHTYVYTLAQTHQKSQQRANRQTVTHM